MLALLGIPVGLVGIVILGLTLRAVRAGRPVRQGTLVVGVVVLAAFTAIALVITIFVVATGGPHETYYAPFR